MSTEHPPTTRPTDPLRLRLRDPGELVAAVPHLLGFRPVDSLVLVAVHGPGDAAERSSTRDPARSRRLGVVARVDLPAPDDLAAVVDGCAARVAATAPDEVIAIVVGGAGSTDPPRRDVADAARGAFAGHGVEVPTRLWVPRIAGGAPWCCYPPCDCRGTVGPTDDSPLAAAAAWLGQVTYGSRAELEASLAPGPPLPRLAALIRAELEAAAVDRELGGPAAARRDLGAVTAARDEVASGRVLTDTEIARVAVALGDPAVRDVAIGWALDPDEALAAAAEQLWTLLVRALPAPEVAEPAVLLACAQLVRGGSALVGVALERALRADPAHRLAGLVGALLASGAGPDAVRSIVRDASAEAAHRLEGRAG
ncbi:DUF4192 domain-containing protein [Actinomycetospora lutea]|uniref:DUF4192 domain-containing protein n=1 Tax=Actinomycetospora lutea TaxID=663604 RepID=UPI0023660B55|nr:DUF4192 domain-containing protein [Actinomycetospora lutea]MDD7938843.1 DUF4192 domain-containing protein [Actinomycetospora lutea]